MRWKIHHILCCKWQTAEWVPEWQGQRVRNHLRFRVWRIWSWFWNHYEDLTLRFRNRQIDIQCGYRRTREWKREQRKRAKEIQRLVSERNKARRQRDFERADRIRHILSDQYRYQVQDTKL